MSVGISEPTPHPSAAPWIHHNAARVTLWSALILVPCFWQSRIQAGDLSSHLYNAWLAERIQAGQNEGLRLVLQWTNALFDRLLRALLSAVSFPTAELLAVSATVLIFFWGAFAFVSAVSRRRPWFLTPCLAMLSYGWVFHMGFFNFYLALGLSLWALVFFLRGGPAYFVPIPLLLPLAAFAHPIPVLWALAIIAYTWIGHKILPRQRVLLATAAIAAILGLRLLLANTFPTTWSARQLSNVVGVEQVWIHGTKYFLVVVALLASWVLLLMRLLADKSLLRVGLGIPFQLCLLTGCGLFLLPNAVLAWGYHDALKFVSERMSLAGAVLTCGFLAAAKPLKGDLVPILAGALLFFAFLYQDTCALNKMENRLTTLVSQLPPQARVIAGICEADSHVDSLAHMLDRVCVGKCFSYGNYEPSIGQFAVRAIAPNPVVLVDRDRVREVELGTYVVRKDDLPLYQITRSSGGLQLRSLREGDITGRACFAATPPLWKSMGLN